MFQAYIKCLETDGSINIELIHCSRFLILKSLTCLPSISGLPIGFDHFQIKSLTIRFVRIHINYSNVCIYTNDKILFGNLLCIEK